MNDIFKPGLFKGKTMFLTGGSSGINLGIAEKYGQLGANVVIMARNPDKIDKAVALLKSQGSEAMGVSCDVRDYDGVEAGLKKAYDRYGELHTVIAGAAGNFLSPVIGLNSKGFQTVIDIDLMGTFNVFRASYDYLAKPGASLIAISARQAVHPRPFQAHACAAKAGVNMFCKCLALEWGQAGIRVNAISPGPIDDTEGFKRLVPTEEKVEAMKRDIPLKSIGTKTDIANMAIYLASDASQYVTGSIFNVDGGNELGSADFDFLTPPKRK